MEKRAIDIGFATVGFVVFALLILLFTGFNPLQNGNTDAEVPHITLTVNFEGKEASEPEEWFLNDGVWMETTGNSSTVIFHNLSAENPFEALETASDIAGWSLRYDNYSYGKMIVSVNGYDNGDGGAYWQYRVNGVYASVSSDSYAIAHGDSIVWSFSSSVARNSRGV